MMVTARFLRSGAPAALVGGLLWALASLFYLLTHGTSNVDQKATLFGFTWYDGGKLLAPALVLISLGFLVANRSHRARASTLGKVGFLLALLGFALLTAGVGLAFWPVAVGSYSQAEWDTPATRVGYVTTLISSLILGIGLILHGSHVLRAKTLGQWSILAIILGGLAVINIFLLGFTGMVFGLGWVLFAFAMNAAKAS